MANAKTKTGVKYIPIRRGSVIAERLAGQIQWAQKIAPVTFSAEREERLIVSPVLDPQPILRRYSPMGIRDPSGTKKFQQLDQPVLQLFQKAGQDGTKRWYIKNAINAPAFDDAWKILGFYDLMNAAEAKREASIALKQAKFLHVFHHIADFVKAGGARVVANYRHANVHTIPHLR